MAMLNTTILGDYIAKFDALVEAHYARLTSMQNVFRPIPLSETNAITRRLMGGATVQKVDATNEPGETKGAFDKLTVYVDTIALVRERIDLLGKIQADFNIIEERAYMQANAQAKFYDEAHFIALIKASKALANATVNIDGGYNATLGVGDDLDPDALYEGVESMLTNFKERDIDTTDFKIFVRPTQYAVLNKANLIANRDFSDGSDVSKGIVNTILNVPIMETSRIPTAAVTGHILSNTSNGNFFDITAAEAKAKVIVCSPRALLVPEAIRMEKNIWWNQDKLGHYVDTMQSFGIGINRQDMVGCLFGA